MNSFSQIHANTHDCYLPYSSSWLQTQASQRNKLIEGAFRPQRFSREDLCSAEILGQVDRKFIVCVFHTGSTDIETDDAEVDVAEDTYGHADRGGTLVLIDQHAADERIRVERFLRGLCEGFLNGEAAEVRPLEPGVHVLLAHREAERISDDEDVRIAFKRWGFLFQEKGQREDGRNQGDRSGFMEMIVRGVPEVVGDKVRVSTALHGPYNSLRR